jgi:hypothetical protein
MKKYGIDRMTSKQRREMSNRILQRLIDGLYADKSVTNGQAST